MGKNIKVLCLSYLQARFCLTLCLWIWLILWWSWFSDRNNASLCFNYKLPLCSSVSEDSIKSVLFSHPLRISTLPSSPKAWLGWSGVCEGPGALVFGVPLEPTGSFLLCFIDPERVNFWGQGSLAWWHHTNLSCFPCEENPKFPFFLPKTAVFT